VGRKRQQKRSQKYRAEKQRIEHEQGGAFANENEPYFESILIELRDVDGVFDFVEYKKELDAVGIDWMAGRFIVDFKHKRALRLFIQLKSSHVDAREFSKLNPCLVMWCGKKSMSRLEAKICLLEGIIEKLRCVESPYAVFFEDKLEHFIGLL